MRKFGTLFGLLAILSLLLVACGGGGADDLLGEIEDNEWHYSDLNRCQLRPPIISR